ncbi:hypothetical protein BDV95DRAFT_604903 [Massariosphaeria phaeospora]|uniref:F-box domain-containing protein n=1 Tax=Massariosphaeria phaeospora TaxID=100035 RepID=A0A7C8MCQ1_9PLEO|nr:hypothetical protein BDV95DRAFT_604903 [Massariosphaeria phaeospora]
MPLLWRSKSQRLSRASLSSVAASKPSKPTSTTADSSIALQTPTTQPTPDPILHPTASPPLQTAPLTTLPYELLQQITHSLDAPSSASLCLSSRRIYHALGTYALTSFLQSGTTKSERRQNIEILERAFPGSWYCAWCDKFHARECEGEGEGGPRVLGKGQAGWRPCVECNGLVGTGREREYVLAFHHVRLAVNGVVWGAEYGIALDAFAYCESSTTTILKMHMPTMLRCEAKVISGHLFLRTEYSVALPQDALWKSDLLAALWPTLPHVLVGHRHSHSGHTGLRYSLENALTRNWKYGTHTCSTCATDYTIVCQPNNTTPLPHPESSSAKSHLVLTITTWRDFGSGRSPFDAQWRAHGELGKGKPGYGGDTIRLTNFQAGRIKRMFEEEREYE